MNLYELQSSINEQVKEYVSNLIKVKPEECGLDYRIYGSLYIDLDENAIVVDKKSQKHLNYYGGFEYIDDSAVSYLGDYVIYRGYDDGSERIQDAIDYYNESH